MRFTILARDELLPRDRNGVGLFRTNRGTPFAGRRSGKVLRAGADWSSRHGFSLRLGLWQRPDRASQRMIRTTRISSAQAPHLVNRLEFESGSRLQAPLPIAVGHESGGTVPNANHPQSRSKQPQAWERRRIPHMLISRDSLRGVEQLRGVEEYRWVVFGDWHAAEHPQSFEVLRACDRESHGDKPRRQWSIPAN